MTCVSRARRAVTGVVYVVGDRVSRHFAGVGVAALALAICALIGMVHVLVSGGLRTTEEHGAATTGVVLARSAFETAVVADSGQLTKAEIDQLDDATAGARSAAGLLELTVYSPEGRILYSPNHRLIGTHHDLNRYERAALAGQVATTPRHTTPEPTDTSKAARIDVNVPLVDGGGRVVALFSLDLPYAPIASDIASQARRLDIVLVTSGLIILLLAVPRLRRAGAARRAVAAREHHMLVRDLGRALEDGQLRLEYQPLAHLHTGHVRAVEALLRWEHPRRGLVPPAEFIPQIEQTALIWPLTEHVLELAIQQAVAWRAQGLDLRVSVNIAAPCLLDRRLPDAVAELLDHSGLPADRLAIELTEESVIRDPGVAVQALLALRSLGIEVLVLDDFGTGYSSLTRLRELPISGLKIDRSFVIDAGTHGDPTLIRAIVDLAHKFGLAVVAEGMEDQATWQRMATLGCDMGQGYWLSRPLRPEALPDWIRGHSIEQWPQPHATVETADIRIAQTRATANTPQLLASSSGPRSPKAGAISASVTATPRASRGLRRRLR